MYGSSNPIIDVVTLVKKCTHYYSFMLQWEEIQLCS